MTPVHDDDRVLVIGESLIDVVQRDGDAAEHIGGSPLNVAVGLARLGVATTFATEFGVDRAGEAIAQHLARDGVTWVQTSDGSRPTSTARARIAPDGSASYEFDLEWNFDVPPATDGWDVVHVGSVGALRSPGGARVIEQIEALDDDVLVTFDPNVRPALLPAREEARAMVERYASRANLIKLSDDDALWLYEDAHAEAPQRLLGRGARIVVVTQGAAGSVIHTAAGRLEVPAYPTVVADTIGAGDAYMAGLIAAILRRQDVDSVRSGRLLASDLAAMGRIAAVAAGITVSRAGAAPPTEHELARAMA